MIDAGVLLLCFDVPSVTKKDAKLYRSLQKELHEAGFVRVQESVYVKLLRHYEGHMTEMARLKERLPAVGKMLFSRCVSAG